MTSPRFDAVGIVVDDLPRSLEFYRLLGVDFPQDVDGQGHVEADLDGGVRLMLDSEDVVKSFDPGFAGSEGPGRITLAFLCDGPDGVDATHDAVVTAGFSSHLAPFDAAWGQRYATVVDPSGNHVDLFAPLG